MDIPSLFMIPSAVSSGKVHSVFPNSTDADFDFNRDSDATRVNSEGLIERVGYYGSELVTNGDFSVDAHWTQGSNISISNGKLVFANANRNTDFAQQSITAPTGVTYKITFTVSDLKSGDSIKVRYPFQDTTVDTNGTHTLFAVGTTANFIRFTPNSLTGTFKLDNVSVKQVTGDRARLNYEIEGGLVNTKPSLLLEPQSTNSFPNSEDYTVFTPISAGTGTNPIITSNYSISPDGTKNADRIQFNRGSGTSGGDTSYITKSLSLGTIDATLSIYLKTNDGTTKDITLRLGAALFDYDVTVTSEWQRFTLSGNTNVDRIQILLYGNKNSQTADLSCFGTQVESLTYATSYIPTNGSTQTRAAETCNGAGTSSIFNDSEGILMLEASSDDTNSVIWSISDGSNNNAVSLYYGSQGILCDIFSSVGVRTIIATFPITSRVNMNKFAVKYKSNDIAIWINGVKSAVNTQTIALSGLNTLGASYGSGSFPFYGKVKQIRVYNTKEMTDSEVDILLTKITS